MTPFIAKDFNVPLTLVQPAFCLQPLTTRHLEKDFEAVIESQERLRRFSNHIWPRPGFTLAENLIDLKRHEAEFNAREAFAFTVIAPDASKILGCVYIYPSQPEDAVVIIWLRDSALRLSSQVLPQVKEWIATSWPFSTVRFVEEVGMTEYASARDPALASMFPGG